MTAAQAVAGPQTYPTGALYVIATPIGNLADISLRALQVLQLVEAIACEDTRHTQGLLRSYGLERPSAQLLAVHQHNEAQAAQGIIARLQQGQRIAYVSDAGTPGVSDPGARLCAQVAAAGLRSIPLAAVAGAAPAFDTVVNTVPAPVLTEPVLEALRPGSLIVDLASRPGGTDFAAAQRLGHTAIHALSLPAACAPETAGGFVAQTVCAMIQEREGRA